jgi:hypothetical protein
MMMPDKKGRRVEYRKVLADATVATISHTQTICIGTWGTLVLKRISRLRAEEPQIANCALTVIREAGCLQASKQPHCV